MKFDMRGSQEGVSVPYMDCLETVAVELLFHDGTMHSPLSAAEALLPILAAMPPATALPYIRHLLKRYGESWGYQVCEFTQMETEWVTWLVKERDSQWTDQV